MPRRFDVGINAFDHAVFVYDECGALHAHDRLAVHFLFLENAVKVYRFLVLVRKKYEGQSVFRGEIIMRSDGILTYTYDHGVIIDQFVGEIPEAYRFRSATGSIVFGIEIHYDLFASEVGKSTLLAVLIGQSEIRRRIAYVQHIYASV